MHERAPPRIVRERLVLAAFAWFFAAGAAAQELPLALSWTAPEGCPEQAQVEADTRAMIARLPDDAASHPVQVDVVVGRGPGDAWQALIRTRSDGMAGERTLRDPSCRALARAVALILALALNADLVEDAPPKPAAVVPTPVPPSPAPAPPPPPAPAPASEVVPPTRPRSPVQLGLGLALGVATGLLPDLAPGTTVRGFVARERLAFELRTSAYLPQSEAIASRPGGQARFVGGVVGLLGCYGSPLAHKLGLAGCAGGELAWVRGESRAIAEPGAASGVWPRVLLGATARLRLPARTALRLTVEGARAFRQPVYAVSGAGNVYRPSTYGLGVALGAELHF